MWSVGITSFLMYGGLDTIISSTSPSPSSEENTSDFINSVLSSTPLDFAFLAPISSAISDISNDFTKLFFIY